MLRAPALLIRGARQLLTLRGSGGARRGLSLLDLGLIPDGAVLIHHGLIQAVGSNRQVLCLASARDCHEIDASGKVVMPAFVDPATSLVQTHPSSRNIERLLHFYGHDNPEVFGEILKDGAHACSALSSQTLKQRAIRTASGMLRHGTGTVLSRAPYALDGTTATKVLRIQTEQTGPLQTLSSLLLKPQRDEAISLWASTVCADLLPRVRRRSLASTVDLELDPSVLPQQIALQILNIARGLGFSIAIHADQCARVSAVPLATVQQAISVAGFRNISPPEIRSLAASSTIAILEPGVTFQTGMSFPEPGRAMLDAGVIPGLASGYHPELSPAYSMQMILLLAFRFYRLTPEEAISAATINNAHALRLEKSVGSLETGKQADVLILNVPDYRELAYYAGTNVIEKVIKRGMLVYDSTSDSTPYRSDNAPASGLY